MCQNIYKEKPCECAKGWVTQIQFYALYGAVATEIGASLLMEMQLMRDKDSGKYSTLNDTVWLFPFDTN